jgi:uncharacterized protein YbjT (DUF2867 family)
LKVLLLGASGMVGQGVLRECLLDARVQQILSVGRTPSGCTDSRFTEVLLPDLARIGELDSTLDGYDVCIDCLGISAVRLTEAEYNRQTYVLTLTIARALLVRNPRITFIYVSGAGTDSSERGRVMWARVKGRTENALLALPFKAAYMFRPAAIQPLHGARSRTATYRLFYGLMAPLMPLLKRAFPRYVTTTEQLGRAILAVTHMGSPKRVLESLDINAMT